MAILVMFEAKGVGRAEYEASNDALGITGEDDAPDGLITHSAALTDDGVLVVDVWESREKLEVFFNDRLRAALESAGIPISDPTILPVHNVIQQGGGTTAGTMVVIDMAGLTTDTYDRMAASMDAHGSELRDHPAVQHVAAVTDDGLLVVDVWESPDAFGAFAESQIGPAAEAAGVTAPIEPKLLPAIGRLRGRMPVAG